MNGIIMDRLTSCHHSSPCSSSARLRMQKQFMIQEQEHATDIQELRRLAQVNEGVYHMYVIGWFFSRGHVSWVHVHVRLDHWRSESLSAFGMIKPEEEEAHSKNELKIIPIKKGHPYSCLDPVRDRHFRLAESQFHRTSLSQEGVFYGHIQQIDYIVNPPLIQRYNQLKREKKQAGHIVEEHLTFHCTTNQAIEAICREGFRIGEIDVPMRSGKVLGHGIYTSEVTTLKCRYVHDMISCSQCSMCFHTVCS